MITIRRWRALEPYLDHALELDADARAAWLADFAAEEPMIAAEVGALIADDEAAENGRFLIAPCADGLEGAVFGAYRLERLLGEGGMGTVWLGSRCDGRFAGCAAIKLLQLSCISAMGQARFRREGSLLARLQHPGIARILDAGVSQGGQPFLVLEYVDGEPIDRYVERQRLSIAERIQLVLEVLAAVEHAHARLIIHRDLKPSNIFVSTEGTVKLLDFGIAKLLDDPLADGQASTAGGLALTPMYAAPEQVRGETLTTATDVYALGVLVYVLISGRHPTSEAAKNHHDCLRAVLEVEPRPLGHGELDLVIAKALQKDPRTRYASVAAFGDDLQRYLAHRPVSAGPHTWSYRSLKFMRRHRTVLALGAVVMVALIGFVGAIVVQGQRATREALAAEAQRRRADEAGRIATEQRDFAVRQMLRAEAVNDLNEYLLADAAPGEKPITVGTLLKRAEEVVGRANAVDTESRVEMLISIGRQHQVLEHDVEARRVLERAQEQALKMSSVSLRAKSACALATSVAAGGDGNAAEALLATARSELSRDPRLVLDDVYCLLMGSEVAFLDGASATAVERAERARQLLRQASLIPPSLDMEVEVQLAVAYRQAGRLASALEVFPHAWSKVESLGRSDSEAGTELLNQWGLVAYVAGQPQTSEQLLRRAIETDTVGGDSEIGWPTILTNLARTLTALARYEEAERYARQALEMARRRGQKTTVGQTMLLRARIFTATGNFVRAGLILDDVEKLLVAQKLHRNHVAFTVVAADRGSLALERGDLAAAKGHLDDAVQSAERSEQLSEFLPGVLRNRSRVYQRLGRLAESEADARRAYALEHSLIGSLPDSSRAGLSALRLGQVLAAAGRTEEARDLAQFSVVQLERTLGAQHPQYGEAVQLVAQLYER